MNINRIQNERPDTSSTPVTIKICGNIIEVRYMKKNRFALVEKKDKNHCVNIRTGEVIEVSHRTNRAEDKASIAQSLKRLRDLINANLTNPETALWVTLTYRENMTDSKRLYQDYRRFWQKFRYYLKKESLPRAEYITAAEPQARGAWHLHCLFLFPCKAPFIPNEVIHQKWGLGFTKTKSLRGIDNPGLYLTAYLGNMELDEAICAGNASGRIAEIETTDKDGTRKAKAIVKGSRLHLYPSGFNLYRHSQNIEMPIICNATEGEAQELIGSAPLTYEKTIALTDESGRTVNTINYRQYNTARRNKENEP